MSIDKSYRDRIGNKVNIFDFIPKNIYNEKNKNNSWECREYPEFNLNLVIISNDGTLGDIYLVDNLYIGLPNQKIKGKTIVEIDGKEEVRYFDKPIMNDRLSGEKAKWHRSKERPIEFEDLWFEYKEQMSKQKNAVKRQKIRNDFVNKRNQLIDEHEDFVDSEFHKRKFGQFVKVDNEVHYLTGENWMFLEHYFLTESDIYPNFRLTQTEAYWHWEACVADSRGWGEIRGKGRRTSWSVESSSMILNRLTIIKYAQIPIVSERSELASLLFQGKVVKSFEYYPIYFKPLIELPDEEAKKTLTVRHETKRRESGTTTYYPTKSTAYDSTKVKDISVNDEVGKWIDASLVDFVSRHSKCHTQGNGKARFGSTAGEYAKGGGEEFEIEFNSANPLERNKITGRTGNGLVNFFIDICYTMTEPMNFFDKWGYSIVHDPEDHIYNEEGRVIDVGAISFWNATHEKLKKDGKKGQLNGFLRDAPRTIEHMFRNEGGVVNDFDIDNLNDHTDYLNNLYEDEFTKNIHVGNLEWKGEPYKSDVMWVPTTKGKFKTTYLPDLDLQNKYSKQNYHGREWNMPDNSHLGALGVDSYNVIGKLDDGSDGTIVGYTKFNMVEGCPSHSFFLIYKERPDERDDFYDDVIKCCQYFGMFALIENNKERLLEYMLEKGYTGWSLRRNDKKWKDLKDHERDLGGIPSSTQVISDQASLLKSYILNNVGQNLETDCKVWFKELIEEWKKFNLQKRKKFDLGVASGMAIMGAQYKVKKRSSLNIGSSDDGLAFSDFFA